MSGYVYPTSTTRVSDSFADHVERGSVNPGTDYVVATGTDVYAVAAGRVVVADGSPDGSGGRTICVYHDDGSSADYLHLNAVSVSVGQRVTQGQRIGFSGASGYGSNSYYGPHLHISFRPHTQIDWFGDDGNVDFDALMRSAGGSTTGAASSTSEIITPTPTRKKAPMEMQLFVQKQGTLTTYILFRWSDGWMQTTHSEAQANSWARILGFDARPLADGDVAELLDNVRNLPGFVK